MKRTFFKSKLHRATVTESDLNYAGSLSMDPDLMTSADILPYEKIEVYNINTGDRFSTYAIKGKQGSGEIGLNGAAARLGHVGDLIIIVTYVQLDHSEIKNHRTKVVLVDEENKIKSIREEAII